MKSGDGNRIRLQPKWRKVAYGGRQPGYDDNYTDESFLEEMVMNASVVKRDLLKVMIDSVSISQYLCIVALVVSTWTLTLNLVIDEATLLKLDVGLLLVGFSVLLLTTCPFSVQLLSKYVLNISFFISGLYVLAPIYHTLTRSISSDSIWALAVTLLLVHLFLHDYSGSTIRPPGLPVCTPHYVLYQEVPLLASSAILLCADGCDPQCHIPIASDVLHSTVGTSCFYLNCLPLLAYKDSGVQI